MTVLSGYRNSFFFSDETAGISVDRTDTAEVHVGDQVEITGTSSPGLFAPTVNAFHVDVAGHSSPPPARRVTYGDLIGGAEDSQWVEVQGVVRSARLLKLWNQDTIQLDLSLGGGSMTIFLQEFAGLDYKRLIDAKVRIRGVCSTMFNEKRQFVGLGMYVPKLRDLDVLEESLADPFSAQVTQVRNILQFGHGWRSEHRVLVKGIATYQNPGHTLYLQDGTDGIRIQSNSTSLVTPGAVVEAVGFPVMGEYSPEIEDGLFRVVAHTVPIMPERIQEKEVIFQHEGFNQVPHDQQLVQLQGEIVEAHIQGDRQIWVLQQDGETFEASLPLASSAGRISDIARGGVVLVSGICIVHSDSDRNPVSFSILLRTLEDFVVLKKGPWWTPNRVLVLLAILGGVTITVLLWVLILRHRVEQQTRTIRLSEQRFRDLAEHDVLTGLPNRLMLEDRIEGCLALCKRDRMRAAFFTIDIDRFKQINDTHGHPIGDEVLKVVATRLRSRVRAVDTIARTGGEEFTLIIGGIMDPESVMKISTSLLDLFQDPVTVPGHEIKVSVSIGGSVYPDDGADGESLRKLSDKALYEAKRTGGNRTIFARAELFEESEIANGIEAALREAIQSNGFSLHYQPIYDAFGSIRRFEALLRATDSRLSRFGPARFIPVAEKTGMIIPLGLWILEEGCRQMAEWRSAGVPACSVAINISARQLVSKGFAEEVLEVLARHGVDSNLLELELTETTLMTNLESVAQTIDQLACAGLTFAIDDFGTGYSSLSRLNELPITTLKIDRSFIAGLEKRDTAYTIIFAIIQMAKGLRLKVVAEGVENIEQFEILRDLGCDFFQGFLFARALPPAAAMKALTENLQAISSSLS